jgi:tetratricopeptide (TPR) repeat protein
MLDSYAAGDYEVVRRSLNTLQDVQAIAGDYRAALMDRNPWREGMAWDRAIPAFALEVASVLAQRRWPGAILLLNNAGELVVRRPDLIGDKPDDDAFEILVHRAAVALAQGVRMPFEPYTRLYEDRISPDPPRTGRRLVDPRFLLSAAIAAEQQGVHVDGLARFVAPANRPREVEDSTHFREAARRYRIAARYDVNAAEASVRLAWVLHRLGQFDEGLAALDGFEARTTDADVIYLGRLFRGQLLDSLGRIEDAARAYEHALEAWPRAQAPAVALSALHLLNGRHDLSLRWATVVRTQEAGPLDPWWRYPFGEGRFFEASLAEMRQAIRR